MNQRDKNTFSLINWLEALLKIGEKSALILAAICLWLMLIEFLNGAPLDPVSTFGKAAICAFVIELMRVVILFIKWARRKRQACKGG
ncbi:hypothetical protein ACSZM9_09570 [Aeromonas hydrophila]|uniref:hypothetical protein n=1 Tax=Aeromonas TaxID=642 RepID=UPI000542FB63|nr:hypothetical protein [Aeromonas hydrophila]KHE13107.1 hypothetical protein OI71_21395 [Aeromonas hydrophila]HCT5132676.1 hypothetical protein [Aeromonas hydrophila]